ncbi:putative metallophosphoesterase [Porphyridium purpureum]|uniref:Putative metallophosphoesterase n=1 Tax=Porphyridium purpureum TaxID=35688 RepID=A0A5J4YY45_PORPP|nr:putative metallophosphoesterase [Porphyridium purpureum]|eukprot:POR5440..scf209_3
MKTKECAKWQGCGLGHCRVSPHGPAQSLAMGLRAAGFQHELVFATLMAVGVLLILFVNRPLSLERSGQCRRRLVQRHASAMFVHATDLHIQSHELDGGLSIRNFRDLVDLCSQRIQPTGVLLGGDLVNAKALPLRWPGVLGKRSHQDEAEWMQYVALRKRLHNVLEARGNHDSLGVPHWMSDTDFFSRYATNEPAATSTSRRLHYRIMSASDNTHFLMIALHAPADPGFHAPLNFFGHVETETLRELEELVNRARSGHFVAKGVAEDHVEVDIASIVLLSHFPPSILSFDSSDARERFMKLDVDIRLSGHLHSLLGIAPNGMRAQTRRLCTSPAFEVTTQELQYQEEMEAPSVWLQEMYRILIWRGGMWQYVLCQLRETCMFAHVEDPVGDGERHLVSVRISVIHPLSSEELAEAELEVFIQAPGQEDEYIGQAILSESNPYAIYTLVVEPTKYPRGRLTLIVRDSTVQVCFSDCGNDIGMSHVEQLVHGFHHFLLYSNFVRVFVQLCYFCLFAGLGVLVLSLRASEYAPSAVGRRVRLFLVVFTLVLACGPLLIVPHMLDGEHIGQHLVTLYGTFSPEPGRLVHARFDIHLHVLFWLAGGYFPSLWLCTRMPIERGLQKGASHTLRRVISVTLALLALRSTWALVREFCGAYGVASCAASPLVTGSIAVVGMALHSLALAWLAAANHHTTKAK